MSLLLPLQLSSGLARVVGSAFRREWLVDPPRIGTSSPTAVLVFVLIEVLTLVSISHAAICIAKEKGCFTATLVATFSLVILYVLPKLATVSVVHGVCKKCEPIGKFCIGVSVLACAVAAERLIVFALTHRE